MQGILKNQVWTVLVKKHVYLGWLAIIISIILFILRWIFISESCIVKL